MNEYCTTERIEDIAVGLYISVAKAKKLFRKEGNLWVTNDPKIIKTMEQSWDICPQ
jgi:hypothetical protein